MKKKLQGLNGGCPWGTSLDSDFGIFQQAPFIFQMKVNRGCNGAFPRGKAPMSPVKNSYSGKAQLHPPLKVCEKKAPGTEWGMSPGTSPDLDFDIFQQAPFTFQMKINRGYNGAPMSPVKNS